MLPPSIALVSRKPLSAQSRARFDAAAALHRFGRLDEAQREFEKLLRTNPGHADVLHLLGVIAGQKGDHRRALQLIGAAVAVQPDHPGYVTNLALVRMHLGDIDTALAGLDRALALRPDDADAHLHRGIVLKSLDRFDESLASFDRALALRPNLAPAHLNRALTELLLGRWLEAWPGYEWRLQLMPEGQRNRLPPERRWDGQPLATGSTVLLHAEQGLGDTIQFCRYAPLLAARGLRVWLEAQPRLVPLLGSLDGVAGIVPAGAPLPPFDRHVPLPSLPRLFDTTPGDVPMPTGYLQPPVERVAVWQARLGERRRPRIGLVWLSGKAGDELDRRSIDLARWLPHLPPADGPFELISLQKQPRSADAPLLAARPDIRHFGAEQNDFGDAAALCALVDLVISVDTSVAHVAGALGRPTWVPLHYLPDWRWLRGRTDTPWYRSMRLFRQQRAGDWSQPLEEIAAALATWPR